MNADSKVELLAPAGNIEGFYGALCAGADAVYLGGSRFGARAYADNFTTEELTECIRYAHLYGVKVYLTVNTLLKEGELEELPDYLAPFYEAGLDAVIVQDIGVLQVIRKQFPGLKIHASTQMTLCSAYGARLLKDMGASRIVPARELSLEELSAIGRSADIELETFIHGAMCYCYSGQCLFSSILGGRSGNRGRCAQPCRLPYTVKETAPDARGRETYPISLKDMCTIAHIPALMEAGIDSFKIEGRMKKPEYAAGVTAIYRKYMDLYETLRRDLGTLEASRAYKVSEEDLHILSSLYIRSEVQDGYYFRQNGREMVTLHNPAYSSGGEEILQEIRTQYLSGRPRIPVTIDAVFETGHAARVTLGKGSTSRTVRGGIVVPAQKQPISAENVEKQLCKLGDSAFYAEKIAIQVSPDAFYPLKQINELRRKAVKELEEAVWRERGYLPRKVEYPGKAAEENAVVPGKRWSAGAGSHRYQGTYDSQTTGGGRSARPGWAVSVRTLEQLQTLVQWLEGEARDCRRIYVDGDLLVRWPGRTEGLCRDLSGDILCMAAFPYLVREQEEGYLEQLLRILGEKDSAFCGFLVRSLDGLRFLQERALPEGPDLLVRTDANIYCWNRQALAWLKENTDGICLPYELNVQERRSLSRQKERDSETGEDSAEGRVASLERIVYGRIPMMVTANCLQKTTGHCRRESGELHLLDRYRKKFPVVYNCMHCMNIIYNSVPLMLGGSRPGAQGDGADLRLDFTVEQPGEMREILDVFLLGKGSFKGEYTTGHERRGVE